MPFEPTEEVLQILRMLRELDLQTIAYEIETDIREGAFVPRESTTDTLTAEDQHWDHFSYSDSGQLCIAFSIIRRRTILAFKHIDATVDRFRANLRDSNLSITIDGLEIPLDRIAFDSNTREAVAILETTLNEIELEVDSLYDITPGDGRNEESNHGE